jgi:hypothetical protein
MLATIICPDDLIATVAALTLAIRVIGGSIGYCVYYNVFICKSTNPDLTRLNRASADDMHSQVRTRCNSLHRRCDGHQA